MTTPANVHDLSSTNPTMRYFGSALEALGLTHADVWDPTRPAGNTAIVGVGTNPTLDLVMAKAAELAAA